MAQSFYRLFYHEGVTIVVYSTALKRSLSRVYMSEFKVPTKIMVGLGTVPLLFVLVGSRTLAEMMTSMGQASEEIFRGDRLPVLHIRQEGS
jgi:hypothetical protein